MKIGEFAKRCNTRILVVRHYDKMKLLSPIHIDNFTGYRYYENGLCTSVYGEDMISGDYRRGNKETDYYVFTRE